MSGARRRLAFVVQRYGEGVTGGSESLARAVAERLAAQHAVTVFTSCARDYVSWANELPEGRETLAGVEVLRFRAEEERDLDAFNRLSEPLYVAPDRTPEAEDDWLRRQGPFLPRLVAALERQKNDFDAVFFFTYLYYPTVQGMRVAPERAILVPTTHDEPPLRFSIYDELFARARGFVFLTPPERELVERRFGIGARPHALAGIGVELPEQQPDSEGFRIRHELGRPYALYAGRIDAGKGCAEMLGFYERYRLDVTGALDLVLIGRLAMPEPRVPGVRYAGFLSETEKQAAVAGARAVVCPSPFESLSIALLEGFAHGVPGLVSERSPVLADHARRSNAALAYADAESFAEALDLLARSATLREALGERGRRYVREGCRWENVLQAYERMIEAVATR